MLMSAELVSTLVNSSVLTQLAPTPVSVEEALSLQETDVHVKVN